MLLSPFTLADVAAVLAGDRDPETARRFGWSPEDASAEKVQAFVALCEERWHNADRVSWGSADRI